ncbi:MULTISPECIES: energy transducer TonB [unclassified Brevundimonas]|jgi:protein TonB|uniref:energy transducer TonB n=1 Tax=unclassified Brevundimonas TaxID=2622653 RepID=UPI00257E4937|nr:MULTISPECIES: energy transducer TonB [unclassified Brevundimonas]|tara:strand:- start:1270 stop:1788 length:519 start_codon:yes stop_codon:yes gene_type:complete
MRTAVISWLFAIILLVGAAALMTWAIHGGIRMASVIEAEVKEDRARSEAPVILVQPDAPPLVAVERTEWSLTPPPPSRTKGAPPSWLLRPQPRYPEEAIGAGIPRGTVELRCVSGPDGQVRDCVVTAETPEGYGFGREALRATGDARMRPAEVDGESGEASASFGVHFHLED